MFPVIGISDYDADHHLVRVFGLDTGLTIYDLHDNAVFFDSRVAPWWVNRPWSVGEMIESPVSFLMRKTRICVGRRMGMFNEFLNGLFAVGYRIPSAVELVIAEIAHYETHGAYLFPGTYLMTSSFFVPDGYVERMVALVRCDGRIGFGACPEDACGDDIAIPLVKKE